MKLSLNLCSMLTPENLFFCCAKNELLSVEISMGMFELFNV